MPGEETLERCGRDGYLYLKMQRLCMMVLFLSTLGMNMNDNFVVHYSSLAPWLAGWLAGWLPCLLAAWLACWLAGLVAVRIPNNHICSCTASIASTLRRWRSRYFGVLQVDGQEPRERKCVFMGSSTFKHLFVNELLRLFVGVGYHRSLIIVSGGLHFVSDTAAALCYLSSVQVDS